MKKNTCQYIISLFTAVAKPYPKDLDLSGLKDVILSEQPSLFPPAIGWWFVLCVFFITFFVTVFYVKRRFFPSAYVYALNELKKIKKVALTKTEVGKEISKLLKRVSIYKFGREEVSLLTDDEWAKFLKENGRDVFSQEELDFIVKSTWMPPQKEIAISFESLYNHTQEWIKFVLKGK